MNIYDLELLDVSLRNFLSFGNQLTTIPLNNTGTTHINGENHDMGGSSGSGKSTLIHAITFAGYDKTMASIGKERLINRTNASKSTQMEVNLRFRKHGDVYEVIRRRGDKNEVFVLRNGVDETPDSVSNTNKKIEELFGISYELFVRVVVFNGAAVPFLDLPLSDQRNMTEELLRITTLSEKATVLKDVNKETEKQIDIQKVLIEQLNKQKAQHEGYVVAAEQRVAQWETEREASLQRLAVEHENLSSIDLVAERVKLERASEIDTVIANTEAVKKNLETSISTIDAEIRAMEVEQKAISARFDAERQALETEKRTIVSAAEAKKKTIAAEVRTFQTKIESTKKQITQTNTDLEKKAAEYEHLAESKCPFCLQQMPNAADKIKEIEARLVELNSLHESQEAERRALVAAQETFIDGQGNPDETVASDIASIDVKIASIASAESDPTYQEIGFQISKHRIDRGQIQESVATEVAKLAKLRSEKTGLVSRFKTTDDLVKIESNIMQVEQKILVLGNETNPHSAAHDALLREEKVVVDETKLNELVKLSAHQKFLIKLLTDKNSFIRKKIISKTIPFMNERLDEYIVKLNLPHTVRFMADMTCEISEFNRILDHGNLSNGERRRLNLALSLAFRDVLSHLHGKINVLLCDEIDAGALDSVNVEMMLSLMKEKSRVDNLGIYMISHRPEFEGRCDHTMVVQKVQGFSTVAA